LDSSVPLDDEDDDMMPIDGRTDATVQVLPVPEDPEPTAGVIEPREETTVVTY
jgi:hypothetical protein